jgi:hydrogenase maturation protein HypF
MKLESAAAGAEPEPWELVIRKDGGIELLSSRALVEAALARLQDAPDAGPRVIRTIAASFQFNLARGIAQLAVTAARKNGMETIAVSGGVAYNHRIRETIRQEIAQAGFECILNPEYPLGDGCVSYGQCVYAGMLANQRA